jgi:hypothetical protein
MIPRKKKLVIRLPKQRPEPESYHFCRLCLSTRREYEFPVNTEGLAGRHPDICNRCRHARRVWRSSMGIGRTFYEDGAWLDDMSLVIRHLEGRNGP